MGNQLSNKMKTNILLLFTLVLLDSQLLEAKKIQPGLIGFANEYLEVLENVKKLEKKNYNIKGRPKVKSVLYDIINNLRTLVYDPSLVDFLTVFIDYSSYIIMPLEGGCSAANAHEKFLED